MFIYSYDANGNLTNDAKKGTTITYNELNKPTIIAKDNSFDRVWFEYDAAGVRLSKTVVINGSPSKEYYIGGVVVESSNTVKYFAMAEGRVRNNSGTLTYKYFITDQQGNTRVSFEDNGSGTAVVRQENSYYPFGMPMAGNYMPTDANKKLYNAGSEWQDEFAGIIDYYSTFFREYDPVIGRFNGVDPRAEMTMRLSIYHYAGNNPVNLNDPMVDWFTDGMAGFGANRNLGGSLSWENAWDKKLSNLNWTDFESGITPGMVARYYQMTWGNQASDISATTATGGFTLSYTATSSGKHYDNTFVSNASITENFAFLNWLDQGTGSNSSNWWDNVKEGNQYLEELHVGLDVGKYMNYDKFNTPGVGEWGWWQDSRGGFQKISWTGNGATGGRNIARTFSRSLHKIAKPIGGITTIVSAVQTYNDIKNGNVSGAIEHGTDTIMGVVAFIPGGQIFSAAYFGIKLLGELFDWW